MSETPTDTTEAEQPKSPDFARLFLQNAQKLAQLAAEFRAIEEALPPADARLAIHERVQALTLFANAQAGRLDAIVRERAHLRQELESETAQRKAMHAEELRARRQERIFFELLQKSYGIAVGKGVRELYDDARAKSATE